MRKRKDIEEEARQGGEEPNENCTKRRIGLLLEVALDIRDAVTAPREKAKRA